MDRNKALKIARRGAWLSEVPAEIRELILARSDLVQFRAEESIYNAGDEPGGLYGVVEGQINMFLLFPDGASGLAHIGTIGLWVGDPASVTGRTRRITVSAATDCHILKLTRARLLALTEEQPRIWRHVAHLTSINLFLAMDIIDGLRRDDPMQRIAATILNLVTYNPPHPMKIKVSQSDLGVLSRLSRSRVNAALAELQRAGWLRLSYAELEVLDLKALARFVRGGS